MHRKSTLSNANTPVTNTTNPMAIQPPTVIDGHCELCPNHERGTKLYLKSLGWGFYLTFEFCPTCEEKV